MTAELVVASRSALDAAPRDAAQRARQKRAGVLLHVTSLPNDEGIGTLGPEAHRFVDLLVRAGQRMWQVLPIHPTIIGDSPYQGPSVFAGNPNLISLRALVDAGDLSPERFDEYRARLCSHIGEDAHRSDARSEYGFLWRHKLGFDTRLEGFAEAALRRSHAGFRLRCTASRTRDCQRFCEENAHWLDDYARFMAMKERFGFELIWSQWPDDRRLRRSGYADHLDGGPADYYRYLQFVFHEQMTALREHAAAAGVDLVGDVAMYPGFDSADVWAHRELFQLDAAGAPEWVAAVPPDYFSASGQLWGNPVYRWGNAGDRRDHGRLYDWWAQRLDRELTYFNTLRIDHFRGFVAYGRAPAGDANAANARWMRGPGPRFFEGVRERLRKTPRLLAEDLGLITRGVRRLRRRLGLPGMRILLFADCDEPRPLAQSPHPYLPHNARHEPSCVFYTGTHDNETLRQRIFETMSSTQREAILAYLSLSDESDVNWQAIDLLYGSGAQFVIVPMQDFLGLGSEARMNCPSQASGWWQWRMTPGQMDLFGGECGARLRELSARHARWRCG